MFVSFFFFLFRRYDSRSTRKKGVCYTNVRRFLFFFFFSFFSFFFFFFFLHLEATITIVSSPIRGRQSLFLFYFIFFFQRSFLRTRSQPIANIRYIMPMPVPFSRYPFLCNSRQRYTLLIDYLIIIYTHEILECK